MTDSTSPLPRLKRRATDAHKGDFGTALIVGGSHGMGGAVSLAGLSALRGGAGLVRLAAPEVCLNTVASFESSYMTLPLPSDEVGQICSTARSSIEDFGSNATCLAVGPGLGRSPDLTTLVAWMYGYFEQPLVLDADAINALAARPQGLDKPCGPRILTPHYGEFRRLSGDSDAGPERWDEQAVQMAKQHGIIIVLKSHHTLITDGTRQIRNTTGNPGLATGGSGDVLTGLITALICQGHAPFDAAQLGVHIHGAAGDLAAAKLGEMSMIASDLISYLPEAIQSVAFEPAERSKAYQPDA